MVLFKLEAHLRELLRIEQAYQKSKGRMNQELKPSEKKALIETTIVDGYKMEVG